tara:strand:- start:185 stop:628 length:444 start_codon:yes stop_codon:yes gene_type:complete
MQAKLTARILGVAGLAPFYLFLLGFWLTEDYPRSLSVQGFVIYSLGILCFLSGALWGGAKVLSPREQPLRLLISNGVVVFAVASVLTAQVMIAAGLLMLGYLALLWYERNLDDTSGWYAQLRFQLTAGVVVAHVLYLWLHVTTESQV